MNQVLGYVFGYGIPLGIALAGMLSILIGFGLLLAWPRQLLMVFVACMVSLASSSGYGYEDPTDANVFWVKGTRSLFFSFVEMGVFGAWLAMLFRHAWQREKQTWLPTSKYYLAFGIILLGWALVGLAEPRHALLLDLSQRGFTDLLWQGMLATLLVSVVRTPADLKRLTLILIVCLAGRHIFGLVRYAAFGGDPQNIYATVGASKVRITFFDINDSMLAVVMFALCSWRVLVDRLLWSGRWWLFAGGAFMALLIPLLSARRTAQIGLLLGTLVITALLPRGRRWPAVVVLVLAIPLSLAVQGQRSTLRQGSLIDKTFSDVTSDFQSDPRRSRFHELRTAWETLKESPILGLGPSGKFKVFDSTGLEYHSGYYDFVHSGFGHIFLKTGLLGLALFCSLLVAWGRYVARGWPRIAEAHRGLAVAAIAGLAALLPTLLVGTPIVELRTMLLMGFLMALPIVCARVGAVAAAPVRHPVARATVIGTRPGGALA